MPVPAGYRVGGGVVTHEEVEARLSGYASGTLAEPEERAVRAHLASGCRDCLTDVFRRPVGLSRDVTPASRTTIRYRRSAAPWVWTMLVLGAAGAATSVAWRDADQARRLAASSRRVVAATASDEERLRGRLAALKTTAHELRRAMRALGAERQGLRSDVALLAGRAREAERRVTGLRAQLDRDSRRAARLEKTVAETRPVLEAAGAPGIHFARFRTTRRYHDAFGHVLWDRSRGRLFVYAFELPFADQPEGYVLRLTGTRAGAQGLGSLQPTGARAARARFAVPPELGCGGRLEVVTADRAETALTAWLGDCDSNGPRT
jgi:hypothetical protein